MGQTIFVQFVLGNGVSAVLIPSWLNSKVPYETYETLFYHGKPTTWRRSVTPNPVKHPATKTFNK
jgi:hypothetical protein